MVTILEPWSWIFFPSSTLLIRGQGGGQTPPEHSPEQMSVSALWNSPLCVSSIPRYTNQYARTHCRSMCSSAICLSAVGPCYLLYSFLPSAFTSRIPVPAVPFTVPSREGFSQKGGSKCLGGDLTGLLVITGYSSHSCNDLIWNEIDGIL